MDKKDPTQIIIKWAFINLFTQVILTYIFYYAQVDRGNNLRLIGYIPMLVYLLAAQKELGSTLTERVISIRQGIEIALGYSIAAGFLFAAFTYISLGTLNPQILHAELAKAGLEMQQRGMDKAQTAQALEIIRATRLLFGSSGKLMAYVLLCVPFGALGAIVLRRTKTDFRPGVY